MARALVIANPAAARNRPLAVKAILDTFRTAGWNTELGETAGPGDARLLAACERCTRRRFDQGMQMTRFKPVDPDPGHSTLGSS